MNLAYVGWVGFGNLGDDAIAEAVLGRLAPDDVVYAAHRPQDLRPVDLRGAGTRHVLLGGGTAIGRRNWRAVINVAGIAQARRRPWFMIGAGVEDPGFAGRNSFSGNGELARWKRTLARFDRVTVRGPRSAELLAGIGVDTTVVGDPALLLRPSAEHDPADDGALGICLGFGDDLWGHGQQRVLNAVADVARSHDGDVRLIVMNDEDRAAAEHVVAAVAQQRPGAASIRRVRTSAEFFAALAGCSVLVSQRLHGAVLAAAADVPVVALEYQPKCRDFMASIAQDDLCLRCDTVSGATLADALADVRDTGPARRAQIVQAVAGYRDLLEAEMDRIHAVTGATTTPTTTTREEPTVAGLRPTADSRR